MRRLLFAAAATTMVAAPVYGESFAQQRDTASGSVIDLALYFPNAQMSRTHYLAGTQVNFPLTSLLGDFSAFTLGGDSGMGDGNGAWDTYAVLEEIIALISSAFVLPDGSVGVIQYLPPYPALARYLDLNTLPVTRTFDAIYAYRANGGTMPGESLGQTVAISRDGNFIKLHWGTDNPDDGYETLWIGNVPIAGTFLTAPGITRYATHALGGIDSHFTWTPR